MLKATENSNHTSFQCFFSVHTLAERAREVLNSGKTMLWDLQVKCAGQHYKGKSFLAEVCWLLELQFIVYGRIEQPNVITNIKHGIWKLVMKEMEDLAKCLCCAPLRVRRWFKCLYVACELVVSLNFLYSCVEC